MTLGDSLAICVVTCIGALVYLDGNLSSNGSFVLMLGVVSVVYTIIKGSNRDCDDD